MDPAYIMNDIRNVLHARSEAHAEFTRINQLSTIYQTSNMLSTAYSTTGINLHMHC